MTTLQPPGSQTSRQSPVGQSDNFAKALLESGGHAVQSTVDTGVQMATDALSSLFGAGGSTATNTPDKQNAAGENAFGQENTIFNQESQEAEYKKREMRMLRHREIQQTEVYNARSVQTERKIDQILQELQALAKDLDAADRQAREAQIAVMQGAVTKGDYHVGFFEQLLSVIVMLRKRVHESTTWLESFNSRKSAKKGYWGQFYSQGMQWAMSQERALATSVG